MMEEADLEVIFQEITTPNKLFCQFEPEEGVLFLDVKNPFTEEDFNIIADIIDPYFSKHGELKGIIVNSKKFPYWVSTQNRAEYFKFAENNHYKFKKAALSMGGFFTKIVAITARKRVHAEVKTFRYNDIEKAQIWVLNQIKNLKSPR
ncbi:MAG: esterase/lipase [Rickettsiales bacterium]|jgi:esterase/lipase